MQRFINGRRPTVSVRIGTLQIGNHHPICIQSMTTSSTRDVLATVDQIMCLADQGCQLVRVTVQGMKEAESCEAIKALLIQKGYFLPIAADIHFYPPAALRVADCVDKVRINPGNFVDKRATFRLLQYDDASYAKEIEKIEETFTPLVEKCKKNQCAMRIGVNHGSLSDRIMNRYGDTPNGMVESALEFTRICRALDYHQLVFSMKSSNPLVMIEAYRLLAEKLDTLGWNYPLHLGVTEAGEGEDGRVKSAMGIGTLLLEGLGDTIRVSLTEDAWHEIPPCKQLISLAERTRKEHVSQAMSSPLPLVVKGRRERQKTVWPKQLPFHPDGAVFLRLNEMLPDSSNTLLAASLGYRENENQWKQSRQAVDALFLANDQPLKDFLEENALWKGLAEAGLQLLSSERLKELSALRLTDTHLENLEACHTLFEKAPSLIFFAPEKQRILRAHQLADWLEKKQIKVPLILDFSYKVSREELVIEASAECGSLLCDGIGDGLCISGTYPLHLLRQLEFTILQAARRRSVRTDFISCPSCGRTLFNLQEVSRRIRDRTAHLPGVKIAIMGCIVNGPGEMADADFGYVGSKPGKVDLYVGKQCVQKDIPFDKADDELIALIRSHGRWVEPALSES